MDPITPLQDLLTNPKYIALEPNKKVEAIRNWERDVVSKRNDSGEWDMETKAIFDVESTQARQAALGIEPMSPQAILESLAVNEEEDRKTNQLFEALTEVESAEREKREINALKFRTFRDDEDYLARDLEVADGKIQAASKRVGYSDIEDARKANEVIQNKRDAHVVRGKLVVKPDLYFDRESFVDTVKNSSATPKEKARVLSEFTRSRENLAKETLPEFQRLTSFNSFAKQFAAENRDATNGDVIAAFKQSGSGDWEKTYNAMARGLLSGVEGVGYTGVLVGDILKRMGDQSGPYSTGIGEKLGLATAGRALQDLAIDGVGGLADTAEAKQMISHNIETAGGLNTGQKLAEVGAQLGVQIFASMATGAATSLPGAIIQQGARKAAKTAAKNAAGNLALRTLAPDAVKKIMATGASRKLGMDEFMSVINTNMTAFAIPAAGSAGPKFYESYERHRDKLAASGLAGEELEEAARSNALTDATRTGIITGVVTRMFGLHGVEGIGRLTQIAANPTARKALSESAKQFTKRVGIGSVGEGFEEALDEGINGALDALLENPDMTFAEWEENVLFAGFAGAVFGAAVEVPKQLLEATANVAQAAIANSPEMVARNAKVAELREQGLDVMADALEEANVATESAALGDALDEIGAEVSGAISRIDEIDIELQAEATGMSQDKIQELRTERETLLASLDQGTDPSTYNPEAVANTAVANLVSNGMDPAEARTKVVSVVNQKYSETPVTADLLAAEAEGAPLPPVDTPLTKTSADFKDPDGFFRVIVGDEAFQDIVDSGVVRTNAGSKPETSGISLGNRPTKWPSFKKGEAAMSYASDNPNHYIIVTHDSSIKESQSGRHGKGTTMFPTDVEGKPSETLDGSKVDVYKNVGEGNYQLVYTKGNAVNQTNEVTSSVNEVPTPVTPVTPVKAEPTFRSIVGRPATVEGETGDIRIDEDGVVVLDRGPDVPPIEISRNPDDLLSTSDLDVALDPEGEADVAQAQGVRESIGSPLPNLKAPIEPITPARAPRTPQNFNVREDGAVVTLVPGGEGQIKGVSDFVTSGFTEDSNEFFVTVKPRNGKPDFDVIGDDAIAIAETLRRNATSRPVTPASQATETVPVQAQEDTQLTEAITASVPEPVLAFDRILTRLILDKPTLNQALIPGKSKLTKEDLDVALDELTTFQTQVENENFPADIKARLDAIVDESLADLTRLSKRAKPAPAQRTTTTPDDAGRRAAKVSSEPTAKPAAEVTLPVSKFTPLSNALSRNRALLDSLASLGVEVKVVKNEAAAEKLLGRKLKNRRGRAFTTRTPSGAPVIVLLENRIISNRAKLDYVIRHEAIHAAHFAMRSSDTSLDDAAITELLSDKSLQRKMSRIYPGFEDLAPASQIAEVVVALNVGTLTAAQVPTSLLEYIAQFLAYMQGNLVNVSPEIKTLVDSVLGKLQEGEVTLQNTVDNTSTPVEDGGMTPTIPDRILNLETRADSLDSERADNANWLFINGKKKTKAVKEEISLRRSEVARLKEELETLGDELEALRETNLAVTDKAPAFAEVVDKYNIPLPDEYVKQGDLYVYQPEGAVEELVEDATIQNTVDNTSTPVEDGGMTPAPKPIALMSADERKVAGIQDDYNLSEATGFNYREWEIGKSEDPVMREWLRSEKSRGLKAPEKYRSTNILTKNKRGEIVGTSDSSKKATDTRNTKAREKNAAYFFNTVYPEIRDSLTPKQSLDIARNMPDPEMKQVVMENSGWREVDAQSVGLSMDTTFLIHPNIKPVTTALIEAFEKKSPFSSQSGISESMIPEGYVKQGELYVYQPEGAIEDGDMTPTPQATLSPGAAQTIIGARRLGNFAGPGNADVRAAILSEITGTKVPKAKAGINALTAALANHFGIDGSTMTSAGLDAAIMDAVKATVPVPPVTFDPDTTPLDASPVVRQPKQTRGALDDQYFSAIEAGDMDAVQRMVDEAANNANNITEAYHFGGFDQTENPIPDTSRGMHFGTRNAAEERAAGKPVDDFIEEASIEFDDDLGAWFWSSQGVDSYDLNEEGFASEEEARTDLGNSAQDYASSDDFDPLDSGVMTRVYLRIENPMRSPDLQNNWTGAVDRAISNGHDAIEYVNQFEDKGSTSYIIINPNQIKSADPITYDAQGNIIPLSQRFNPNSDSILEAQTPTNFTAETEWTDVVTSLVNRAIQKYPNIPIRADNSSSSLARTQGLDMTINPSIMAESTAGMGPSDVAQVIDKIIIHEATHRRALSDLDPEFPTQYAAQMTVDERLDTARGYLHRSAYSTDEAYNTAVRQFAGVEGNSDPRTTHFKLGHEALRMLSERLRTGYTTEETIAFLKMNPTLFQRAIQYLKAYVNRLTTWAQTRKDPTLYAEMKTLNKAVWEMENGPHVERGAAPFVVPGSNVAPAPMPRTVFNSVLGREIAVAASPVNRDPAVMRHGELEAKHNAGTITPQETAEAQALVEEAAQKAGDTTGRIFHGGKFNQKVDPIFRIPEGPKKRNNWQLSFGTHFAEKSTEAEAYLKKGGDLTSIFLMNARILDTTSRPSVDEGGTIDGAYAPNSVIETFDGLTRKRLDEWASKYAKYPEGLGMDSVQGLIPWGVIANILDEVPPAEASRALKAAGFDAVKYEARANYGNKTYRPFSAYVVVGSPNIIKSADPFTGVPLDERFNPESDSILEASHFGKPSRVPIRYSPKPGEYTPGGYLTAAFRWDPRIFEMLQKARGRFQSLIKEAEFFHKDLNDQLKKAFGKKDQWPTDTVNLALGNTDNRMTEADVEAIKRIKSRGLAAAQGNYLRARALAKQQDDAGMLADAALTRQDARAAFDAAIDAYKTAARTYEDNARIAARVRAEADRDAAINSLPDDVQVTVRKMRLAIDALSAELVRSGALPDDLKATIDANQGLWLHRSYRIFDQENYAEWIQESKDPEAEQLRNKTVTFVRDDLIRKEADKQMAKNPGMTRAQAKINAATVVTNEDVMKSFNGFLHIADGGVKSLLAGATISKDVDALMKRGVIPKEIQELWGVYTDPTVNAAKSLGAVAQFVTQHQFLTNLVDLGTSEGWLSKDQYDANGVRLHELAPNNGMSGRYNGSPSTQWAPLSGYYGPRALAEAIADSAKNSGQDVVMKTMMQLTGFAMATKTVLSWQSVMRNFWGNILFTVANGNATTWNAWKTANTSAAQSWSNFYGNGSDATRARVKRLIELGVFGDAMTENLIRDLTNGFESDKKAIRFFDKMAEKTFLSKLTGGAGKVFKTSARFYSLPDEFWKVVAFEGEVSRVQKYMPNATLQQQEEEAARIVKATMPTYSEAPEIVQFLRRNPFMAPFITFTTEVYRTSVNTVKLAAGQIAEGIKTNNKELRNDGLRRTLGITLASAGVYGVTLLLRSMAGFNDEDEDDLRNHVPVWDENSTLMILPTDRTDGKIDYMNISYMNPYDVWSRPFRAFVRGLRDPDSGILETAKETIQELFDPVLSEQIFIGSVLDVARGVTLAGKEIYDKTDSDADKITQSLSHIFKQSLMPGTLTSADRIIKASEGYVAPGSGRSYDKWNEIFSGTLGMKFSSIDTSSTLQFSAKQFKANRSDSIYTFSKPFKSNGTQSDEAIRESYVKANAKLKRSQLELYKKMVSAVRLGTMTQREALRQMSADGVTDEVVRDILQNRFRRYEPSTRDLNEAKKKGDKLGQDRISLYKQARLEVPPVEKLSEDEL